MSDERLRQLERRWRETGAAGDEAAYLRERVRVGELPRERLELAAYCGHEAASGATGVCGPRDLEQWVAGLSRWDMQTAMRAALAAARFAYPVWSRGLSSGMRDGEWVTEALRAAERCVLTPSSDNDRAAARAASDAFGAASESDLEGEVEGAAAEACALAARAASANSLEAASSAIHFAARAESPPAVLSAIWDELTPWALGHEDPVARWQT